MQFFVCGSFHFARAFRANFGARSAAGEACSAASSQQNAILSVPVCAVFRPNFVRAQCARIQGEFRSAERGGRSVLGSAASSQQNVSNMMLMNMLPDFPPRFQAGFRARACRPNFRGR